MSWIVTLLKFPSEIKTLDDIPPGFMPEPLGSRNEVLSLLAQLFPDANLSDPTWVTLDRDEYVIEFMVGDKDPVMSLGFRPHGSDALMKALQLLCERTGWRALDENAEFIEFDDDPAKGLRAWREYTAQLIGPSFNPKGICLSTISNPSKRLNHTRHRRMSLRSASGRRFRRM